MSRQNPIHYDKKTKEIITRCHLVTKVHGSKLAEVDVQSSKSVGFKVQVWGNRRDSY